MPRWRRALGLSNGLERGDGVRTHCFPHSPGPARSTPRTQSAGPARGAARGASRSAWRCSWPPETTLWVNHRSRCGRARPQAPVQIAPTTARGGPSRDRRWPWRIPVVCLWTMTSGRSKRAAVYQFIPNPLETLPFIPKCEFEIGGSQDFIGKT